MAIEDRNLPVGTRLEANYKKVQYVCTVEAGEGDEGLAFVLEDGSRHKSPSAAGSKVMGGKAVNGWRFWSLEGAAPVKAEKAPKPEKMVKAKTPGGSHGPRKASKTSATKKARKTDTLSVMDSQEDVAEGHLRIWCRACCNGYIVEGTDLPETCPQGHSNDDPELSAPSGITAAQEAEVTA
jgi:hypothetical protein